MKYKNRKEKHTQLYIVIEISTDTASIYKEITPLSEKIGVNRVTIYRKFSNQGDVWVKNGYKVYKVTDINIKSRRGK
jgi:DNA-binding phage protein